MMRAVAAALLALSCPSSAFILRYNRLFWTALWQANINGLWQAGKKGAQDTVALLCQAASEAVATEGSSAMLASKRYSFWISNNSSWWSSWPTSGSKRIGGGPMVGAAISSL